MCVYNYKEATMAQIRVGSILALILSLAALAQAQVTTERPAPGATEMRRASQILGSSVRLNDGTGYGKGEDFVIGPDNSIEFLIVNHENQYTALPYSVGTFVPAE